MLPRNAGTDGAGTSGEDRVAIALLCALLGLVLGSFASVVVTRVPRGASVVAPASACVHCGARLRAWHNVPVASYVALRGACAACRGRISPLYPLLELGTAVAFALVGLRLGWSALLPAQLVFTWLLIVLAVIDARTRRIPNRITYPAAPVLVTLVLAAALLDGDPGIAVRSVLGGLAAGGALLALALINPRGMGMGDVKLAVLIGLGLGALGWGHLLVGLFTAFLLGGVLSLALVAARSRGPKDLLPFGPHLAAGSFAALLAGGWIWEGYLGLVGLA